MTSAPDADRQRLDRYAAKVAAELKKAGFARDLIELSRQDWKDERSGFLGLSRKRLLVTTSSTQQPGWLLLTDFWEQRDIYETDYSRSRPRRGTQSHELVTKDQVWLSPQGQLLSYFVTHEIVFHGMRQLVYLSGDHPAGPSQDWHLLMYDHWRRTHTRKFTAADRVKETITNSGQRRYRHRFQGVSSALTELRKRAGTYVAPRGRS